MAKAIVNVKGILLLKEMITTKDGSNVLILRVMQKDFKCNVWSLDVKVFNKQLQVSNNFTVGEEIEIDDVIIDSYGYLKGTQVVSGTNISKW